MDGQKLDHLMKSPCNVDQILSWNWLLIFEKVFDRWTAFQFWNKFRLHPNGTEYSQGSAEYWINSNAGGWSQWRP